VFTKGLIEPAMRTAQSLDRRDRLQMYRARQTGGGMVLSTTETAIPGARIELAIKGQNAFALAFGVFDFTGSPAAAFWLLTGRFWVDGSARPGIATKYISKNDRVTSSRMWAVALVPGLHTFELHAFKGAGNGTATVNELGTALTLLVGDYP
jgi:hypothetical protein